MTKPLRRTRRKAGEHPATIEPAPDLSPLEFVLRIMRDETQSPALRAGMAKAAMPYMHRRPDGDVPPADGPAKAPPKAPPKSPSKAPPMSDLELARRIAHILSRAQTLTGNPVEKPANAGQDGTQDGAVGAKTS
ncbi:MAG TPA: hypothetical protein VJL90_01755 [Pseudorhodoplanes sp.]|nr:hypothetical protein [Pseudorhodoplanes sp.]